jgi:group I intron endonuclease
MINEKILNLPFLMYKNKMYIKWNSKISGIYAWINEIDGKMYIGQTNNFYKRIYDEMNGFCNGRHQNMFKLFNAIQKYGINNFRVVRLLECPVDYLNKIEILLIKYYDTKENGYNITIGGDGTNGHVVTLGQIEKQKKSLKKHWTEGKRHEHSKKMKIWFNSKSKTEQNEIRSGNGWWLNSEYKIKHLENTKKSLTAERIEKQKKSLMEYYKNNDSKKRIITEIMSPTNEIVKINGLNDFCRSYKTSYTGIQYVLNGNILYYKGWHLQKTPDFIPFTEKVCGPDGIIYSFTSITKFCKEKNIDKSNLRKMLNGICDAYKGYKKV